MNKTSFKSKKWTKILSTLLLGSVLLSSCDCFNESEKNPQENNSQGNEIPAPKEPETPKTEDPKTEDPTDDVVVITDVTVDYSPELKLNDSKYEGKNVTVIINEKEYSFCDKISNSSLIFINNLLF